MAKPSATQRIADIFTNIEAARRSVEGLTRDQFEANQDKPYAVLYRLQSASEATTRLKADWPEEYERLEREHSNVNWQMFRNLANRYRHGYDQINYELVWNDLHGYTQDIQRALASDLAMLNVVFDHNREVDGKPDL